MTQNPFVYKKGLLDNVVSFVYILFFSRHFITHNTLAFTNETQIPAKQTEPQHDTSQHPTHAIPQINTHYAYT